jgi:hypothetical protein
MKQPSVVDYARSLYAKHPELAQPVRWQHFLRMAERSNIAVRIVPLSRPARLIRYGQSLCIQLRRDLNHHLRTMYGMHELVHAWRDELGIACIYADDETVATDPKEDFADLFAWFVTSEARIFHEPIVFRRPPGNAWSIKLQQLEAVGYDEKALAIASSQTECRIRDWKRGRGKPDPATAMIFERMLAGARRKGPLGRKA